MCQSISILNGTRKSTNYMWFYRRLSDKLGRSKGTGIYRSVAIRIDNKNETETATCTVRVLNMEVINMTEERKTTDYIRITG